MLYLIFIYKYIFIIGLSDVLRTGVYVEYERKDNYSPIFWITTKKLLFFTLALRGSCS